MLKQNAVMTQLGSGNKDPHLLEVTTSKWSTSHSGRFIPSSTQWTGTWEVHTCRDDTVGWGGTVSRLLEVPTNKW